MKRDTIVGQLIKEGFSEKTLVNFSDKQLSDLHERIVIKADKLKTDPKLQAIANDPNTEVEVKEEETIENCDGCDKPKKECTCGKEVKEWVEKVTENSYHSFTSKNDIMELIQTKLNESESFVPMPAKAKKGHNDVMEFMTYDAAEPATKPKEPTTKPGTKEPPKTRPSHPGKNPNPGVNPGPKAIKPEEAKDKVIKVIKGILQK
jgi:hypothetical protein